MSLRIKWLCCIAWYFVSMFLVELTLTRRISECKGFSLKENVVLSVFIPSTLSSFYTRACMHHTRAHTHTHTMSVIVTLTEPFTMREKNGIAVHSKLKSSCQIIFCHPSTDTLHFFRWLQDLKTRWDKVWWPYIYMFRLWYFWNHLNYHVDEQLVVGDIGIKIMYYLH